MYRPFLRHQGVGRALPCATPRGTPLPHTRKLRIIRCFLRKICNIYFAAPGPFAGTVNRRCKIAQNLLYLCLT